MMIATERPGLRPARGGPEMNKGRPLDRGSYAAMAVTLVLFMVALFVKGLGRDLLLEAGVFLVSVKLIMMAHKNAVSARQTQDDLKRILTILEDRAVAHQVETR
jgi:hypothetical protein